jgi:AcrR family transcriptional regulator
MNVQLNTSNDKIQAIFKSTLTLIKDFGFHGCPMSRIAQDAEVATGTIYHYFDSKDALIIALFYDTKIKAQKAAFYKVDPTLPYEVRFKMIWTNIFRHFVANPEAISFLDQFYSSPYVKGIIYGETQCLEDEISNFLEEGVTHQFLKSEPLSLLSSAYMGILVSTVKRHCNGSYVFNEEGLSRMVEIVWEGIKLNPIFTTIEQ